MRSLTEYLFMFWVLACTSRGMTPTLDFCSESSINTYTDLFTLDGTSAVEDADTSSCKCSVTLQEPLSNVVGIARDSLTRTSTSSQCNTRLDVFLSNGTRLQSLHCDWSEFEVTKENVQGGLLFYLHVFVSKEEQFAVHDYKLHIRPGAKSHLIAHCSPAASGTTPGEVTVLTESSSTLSPILTTTAPTPVSSGAHDTGVIIGVVIGLGLFMLVLISCLLCYIARRPGIRERIPQIPESPQEQQDAPRQNFLRRTLTRARDKITQSRPLPKIPATLRKFTLRRKVIDRDCQSGYYASIRSDSSNIKNNNNTSSNNSSSNNNNGHVTQQLSVESSTSYIHPNEVNPPARPNLGAADNDTTHRKFVSTISDYVASDDHHYVNGPRNLNIKTVMKKADDKNIEQIAPKTSVLRLQLTEQQTRAAVNLQSTVDGDSFHITDVKLPNVDENNYEEYVEPECLVDREGSEAHRTAFNASIELNKHSDAMSSYDCLTSPRGSSDYSNLGPNRFHENSHSEEESANLSEDNNDNNNHIATRKDTDYENAPVDGTYLPMRSVHDKIPSGFECASNDAVSNHDTSVVKDSLASTDSEGYMPMKDCAQVKDKSGLEKKDSTFPNLLSFRAHGTSNQQEDRSGVNLQNVSNDLKRNKIKIKRYVKDKRAS